jgi:Bacterial Ig-like domain (group 2)
MCHASDAIRRMPDLSRWLALAVIAAAAGGCNFTPKTPAASGTGGGGGPSGTGGAQPVGGLTALQISPAMDSLSVSQGGPAATKQYQVTGTVNGQSQDLTSMVNYSATPNGIVTVDSKGLVTATGKAGGRVTIIAISGSLSTQATLVVNFSFTGADPGPAGANVPPDASSIFSGAAQDDSRAPQLVYPNDGVIFPPNITGVEVHFLPGTGNTLFQVTFAGMFSTISTFVRCTAPTGINGCIYLPDPSLWASVAGANAGQGTVKLTVTGTDDMGTAKGTSAGFTMAFAQDNVEGALYYWTTSGKTAIMRWDFAGTTTAAMPYLTPTNTDGRTCVGCHALAPNGDKLVASVGGENDGRLLLWNVSGNAALRPFPLAKKSQFESWNSDGTQFVGVYGDSLPQHTGASDLMIFDGATGTMTSTIMLGGLRADHPDWSKNPEGPDTIVFTSIDATAPTTDQKPATGGIDYVRADSTGAWGQPQQLVPSELGKNRYYPAISPDGKLVVYDESTCTRGTPTMGRAPDASCNADTDPTATMYLTSFDAGATPVAMARANAPGVADGATTALTNSYPRWAPFIQKLDEMHKLIWLTFSSTRQYGLRSPPPSTGDRTETTTGTLIWMVGVSPGGDGADPSYAAFCLPFQDLTTSNHIAQWAKYFIMGPG